MHLQHIKLDLIKTVRTDDFMLNKRNQDISNRTVYVQSSFNTWLSEFSKKIIEEQNMLYMLSLSQGESQI